MGGRRIRELGIALGGGGMKGLAHLGALAAVEGMGLYPGCVAGTSIGALVGALYCTGMPVAALRAIVEARPLLSLVSLRFDGRALLDVKRLKSFLNDHLGRTTRIEDLPIPFCCVATDLETGARVDLDRGPVVDAVLASAAIPGVFAPIELGDRLLVDGGLRDNLPVEPLRDAGCEKVIGVRLFHQSSAWSLDEAARTDRPSRRDWRRWKEQLKTHPLQRLPAIVAERWLHSDELVPDAVQIAQRGLDLVMVALEESRLTSTPPDVLIEPDVTFVGVLDFHEDKQAVFSAGLEAAEKVADDLSALKRTMISSTDVFRPEPESGPI